METKDQKEKSTPIFRNLTADDPDPETTEIESLCMNCGENVRCKLLFSHQILKRIEGDNTNTHNLNYEFSLL